MAAFFQMGHDTENLVGALDLEEFKGIVLSPVNRDESTMKASLSGFREKGIETILFDPQMYFPKRGRGKLSEHRYFPKDIDTADLASDSWWSQVVNGLTAEGKNIGIDALATPVLRPKVWNLDYWNRCASTFYGLKASLSDCSIQAVYTLIIDLDNLSSTEQVFRIASTVSETGADAYYVVLITEIEPRRELTDSLGLCGFMHLINLLRQTEADVTVSHSGSDVLLFKIAGATNCATGKFFNLRRFTKSRFDEPGGGGGQIAYWFEPALLAFLRQADVLRLKRLKMDHLLGKGYDNIWTAHIERNFALANPAPWLSESWKQYLSWFGKVEKHLNGPDDVGVVREWLTQATANWKLLEDKDILMEEEKNDGAWLRPWRQAIQEFTSRIS